MKFTLPAIAKSLALIAATLLHPAHAAENGVTDKEIVIGTSMPLSGPLAAGANAYLQGALHHFKQVNAAGGVNGRTIRMVPLDDAFDVERGKANIKKLIEEDKVFALVGVAGTALNLSTLPLIGESRTVNFSPLTGADALKAQKVRPLFATGSGYGDQVEKMVEQLTTTGIKNIGIAFQDDAFGKSVLAVFDAAMKKRNLKPTGIGPYKPDGSNLKEVAALIAKDQPGAIIIGGAGRAVPGFIGAYQGTGNNSNYYCLSIADSTLIVKELGIKSRGVVIAQATPFPWDRSIQVVREYQAAHQANAGNTNFEYNSMNAYLWAKVFTEALRRTGKDLTRDKFITALEAMSSYDAGGFMVKFSPDDHIGSRFVELTIIGRDGKFIR